MNPKNISKSHFQKKKLKKIERQIWWTEVKIGWLRFLSGRSVSEPLMYFVIAIPLFIFYLILDNFFISKISDEKLLKVFVIALLILFSLYLENILERKSLSRINSLEQKLSDLYKVRRNLIEIINNKS